MRSLKQIKEIFANIHCTSSVTEYQFNKKDNSNTVCGPWVLVSEVGHREGDGVGVLGLGVCRGLMDEFKLLRTAFGAAELASEWGAVAPRKPKENRKERGQKKQKTGGEWISGGPVNAHIHFSD